MSHHSDRHNLYSKWKSIRGITYAILAMVLLSQTAITMAQNSSLGKLGSASGIDLQVLSTSIASDGSGNIYYVNTAQSTLYRVATTGVQTELQCCGALGGLAKPRGVAIDSQGNLYIADTGNNRIVKLDQSGNASAVSTGLFSLSRPAGVALDLNNDLYISDAGNNRVLEIAAAGGQAFVVGTTGFSLSNPSSVSIDKNNTLYIADTGNNRIVTVPASGSPSLLFDSQIQSPLSVTIDGNGNGFISQSTTHVVTQGGSSGSRERPVGGVLLQRDEYERQRCIKRKHYERQCHVDANRWIHGYRLSECRGFATECHRPADSSYCRV